MSYEYIDEIDSREYSFGDEINNSEFNESLKSLSVVSYKYIDLDVTEYHFLQECFNNEDIKVYFDFINLLTSNPFDDVLNIKQAEWHLNPNNYFKEHKLRSLVNKVMKLEQDLKIECVPPFYHFALHTSNEKASKINRIKAPRVYFFIGRNATLFPLFYDPYHEINP